MVRVDELHAAAALQVLPRAAPARAIHVTGSGVVVVAIPFDLMAAVDPRRGALSQPIYPWAQVARRPPPIIAFAR